MSNTVKERFVKNSFEVWINIPGIRKGILSVYSNEPFDYTDERQSYEIGRQIAILAKSAGMSTRGSLLRKKAGSNDLEVVKTKYPILIDIVRNQLMFDYRHLIIENY
jgi:hypothetical protein